MTKKDDTPHTPVLIELDDAALDPLPSEAPPISDTLPGQADTALQRAAHRMARPPSRLGRWFRGALAGLIALGLSVAAWDVVTGLFQRSSLLGYAALVLVGICLFILLLTGLREWFALLRLKKIDHIKDKARLALSRDDLHAAHAVGADLLKLYEGRPDARWGMARFRDRQSDLLDAETVLHLAEAEVLAPLDAQAQKEVEAAARQVAAITALVPMALADLLAALVANIRMIRRIADIYGGRSGALGSGRLLRAVLAHLVATGAVAIGDDLIGSVASGGMMSKISRRFGEGVINGALTARVGIAALEVCRPLPFHGQKRPAVGQMVKRALTGLFRNS